MPASIFAGSKVKTLKSTLSLNGGADIISSTTNPQTSAVSAEPGSLLLNTTSGTMYRKLDAGSTTNWVEVGAGTGGKNYIKNPDFDGGATTSWSMQKVSLSSFIPTGNIGAADAGHTIATSSSLPLEGANSLLVQGASLFTAGNCLVSAAFTIDREDVAKVMGWSFSYEAITTNMDFSGTSANTWAVYIAEVTTGTPDTVVSWIQPAGVYNMTQGSGVGLASGTFQTTSTESSAYRIVLVCINSEAAATTLKVDDFQLGPQKVVYGSPVTDWATYTPSTVTNGTIGGSSLQWRRVGNSLQLRGRLSTATITGAFSFSLPDGLSVDTTQVTASGGNILGVGTIYNTPSAFSQTVPCVFAYAGPTALTVRAIGSLTTDVHNYLDISGTFPYDGVITIQVSALDVPISGWSSSVQMSNDTDTRVVAAGIKTSGAQTIPINTNVPVSFTNVLSDSHSAFIQGSGYVAGTGVWGTANDTRPRYIIPVSGWYNISGVISYATAASGLGYAALYVDNAAASLVTGVPLNAGFGVRCPFAYNSVYLTAGQAVDIRGYSQTATTLNQNEGSYLSIHRLSGPATIAASETVAARYSTNAGSNTLVDFGTGVNYADFEDKEYDTHGIVSGAGSGNSTTEGSGFKITIPISGKYRISAHAMTKTGYSWAAAEYFSLAIRKQTGGALPGVYVAASDNYQTAAHTTYVTAAITSTFDFQAGDTVQIAVNQTSGVTIGLITAARYNFVEIERIG